MPFLKALLWVAVVIAMVIFAVNNWVPVTIALWGDLLLDTKLPVLIVAAFLIGWLPLYLIHRGSRWRTNRHIMAMQGETDSLPRNYIPDPNAPIQPTSQMSSTPAEGETT